MDQELGALAGAYPAVSEEAWRAVVRKALAGSEPDAALGTRTDDGLWLKPLYGRADWAAGRSGAPGAAPFTRGRAAPDASAAWDVRTVVDDPRLEYAAAALKADLEGGATSIALRLGRAGAAGPWGLRLAGVDDLEVVLAGVPLSRTPLVLDAGGQGFAAAAALMALWMRRGLAPDEAQGALTLDPLGAFAAEGMIEGGLDSAFELLTAFTRKASAHYGGVTALGVDTRPYHAAGASEAQEIAFALATGVAYLRLHERASFSLADTLRQMEFIFAVDGRFFLSIAKLRAARLAWGRVLAACGESGEDACMRIWAEGAWRDLARRDAHVNMLRGTTACFAAALGGAAAISVRPYDEALSVPGLFGRRIARNTGLVLAEEAGLGRVQDPAGGSWYLERLTEELAEAAWAIFREIEGQGGMAAALQSGWIAQAIAAKAAARRDALTRRRLPLTGVSLYPDLAEPLASQAEIDGEAVEASLRARTETARRSEATKRLLAIRGGIPTMRIEAAFETLEAGAALADAAATLAGTGVPLVGQELPVLRLAAPFEALRDASDALDRRPQAFLATWGKPRDYADAAAQARAFLAIAGIEAAGEATHADISALGAAARTSASPVVVLCTSARLFAEAGAALVDALRQVKPRALYLAGPPDAAGVPGIDAVLDDGADSLDLLASALAHWGARVP